MRVAALAGVLAIVIPAGVAAGPWPVGAGAYYAKLAASHLATDTLATPEGREVTISEFERSELSLYVEYGLSERWTAILSAPLISESSLRDFGDAYGPGDVTLGLQRQLASKGAWVFALRGLVQAPTGDEELGQRLLPTGSGALEGELLVSLGRSLSGGRGWTYLEAGHRARGEGLTDALSYRAQIGVQAGGRWRWAWNLYGIEPYSSRSGGSSVAAGFSDGVRYLAFGAEALIEVAKGWSVELGLEDTTRTKNLATGITARLGVSLRR